MLKIVPVLSEKIMLLLKTKGEDIIFDLENLFFPIFFFLKIYYLFQIDKYYQENFDDLS